MNPEIAALRLAEQQKLKTSDMVDVLARELSAVYPKYVVIEPTLPDNFWGLLPFGWQTEKNLTINQCPGLPPLDTNFTDHPIIVSAGVARGMIARAKS